VIDLFGVPLYDDDLLKLVLRFCINWFFLTLVVRFIYFRISGTKEYVFTYFMINIMVFFICFTLKKFDLGLGMAIGLFAIFGILRYRTDAIPIKEMTYLFIVIGIAVVNSLANKKMSYAELAFTNMSIVVIAAVLENLSFSRREMWERVIYERIDLVKPDRHTELLEDLEQRTGLKISRIELGRINFLRDTVSIDVFYYPHEQDQNSDSSDKVSRSP
jgi:hypothetical protein